MAQLMKYRTIEEEKETYDGRNCSARRHSVGLFKIGMHKEEV